MRERPDGRMEITATLPESLADKVKHALDNNPELVLDILSCFECLAECVAALLALILLPAISVCGIRDSVIIDEDDCAIATLRSASKSHLDHL